MSYIKADNEQEQICFDFLEDLRQSGDTNMFGAGPYVQRAFGLSKEEARDVCLKWMELHDDPARKLNGPSTTTKKTVRIETTAHVEEEPR